MKTPELTVEEMLSDPIVKLVMRRDSVTASDIRNVIDQARKALRLKPAMRDR